MEGGLLLTETSNVIGLRGATVEESLRDQFIRHLTDSYDNYVREHGFQPECLFGVWCGVRQPAMSHWITTGESRDGGATAARALAIYALQMGDMS